MHSWTVEWFSNSFQIFANSRANIWIIKKSAGLERKKEKKIGSQVTYPIRIKNSGLLFFSILLATVIWKFSSFFVFPLFLSHCLRKKRNKKLSIRTPTTLSITMTTLGFFLTEFKKNLNYSLSISNNVFVPSQQWQLSPFVYVFFRQLLFLVICPSVSGPTFNYALIIFTYAAFYLPLQHQHLSSSTSSSSLMHEPLIVWRQIMRMTCEKYKWAVKMQWWFVILLIQFSEVNC